MNEFVNQCRREWKRLGVARSTADEMAAELSADLAEGTPEEVLGSDADDARSFARAWAVERGAVSRRGRLVFNAATVACALAAIGGAVLLIVSSPSDSTRLRLQTVALPVGGPQRVWVGPPLRVITERVPAVMVKASPPPPLIRIVDEDDAGFDGRTAGLVLLVVGLAGLVPLTLIWLRRVALDR